MISVSTISLQFAQKNYHDHNNLQTQDPVRRPTKDANPFTNLFIVRYPTQQRCFEVRSTHCPTESIFMSQVQTRSLYWRNWARDAVDADQNLQVLVTSGNRWFVALGQTAASQAPAAVQASSQTAHNSQTRPIKSDFVEAYDGQHWLLALVPCHFCQKLSPFIQLSGSVLHLHPTLCIISANLLLEPNLKKTCIHLSFM